MVPVTTEAPARLAPTTAHKLNGTGDTLQIYEGNPTFWLPFTHNGTATTKLSDSFRIVTVEGTVHWQTCDEQTCGLPQRQQFTFDLPAAPAVAPDIGAVPPTGVSPMNGNTHFRALQQRRESGK